jgi:hypothetical protein
LRVSLLTALAIALAVAGALLLLQASLQLIESRRRESFRLARSAQRLRRRAILRIVLGAALILAGFGVYFYRAAT